MKAVLCRVLSIMLHFRKFFSQNIYAWSLCGIWFPKLPSPERGSNKVAAVIIHFGQIVLWSTQWVHLTRGVENLTVATDVLTMVIIFSMVTMKGFLMIGNTKKMQTAVHLLEQMEATTIGSKEEEAIILDMVPKMRRNWITISGCGVICCTLQFITCLVKEENILLHASDYPYDTDNNNGAYYTTLIFQYIFAFHTSIILGTLDTIGPNMMLIMKTYLLILNGRLRALGWETDKIEAERKLRECLMFHKMCTE